MVREVWLVVWSCRLRLVVGRFFAVALFPLPVAEPELESVSAASALFLPSGVRVIGLVGRLRTATLRRLEEEEGWTGEARCGSLSTSLALEIGELAALNRECATTASMGVRGSRLGLPRTF